jgi:hypothetical protein
MCMTVAPLDWSDASQLLLLAGREHGRTIPLADRPGTLVVAPEAPKPPSRPQ